MSQALHKKNSEKRYKKIEGLGKWVMGRIKSTEGVTISQTAEETTGTHYTNFRSLFNKNRAKIHEFALVLDYIGLKMEVHVVGPGERIVFYSHDPGKQGANDRDPSDPETPEEIMAKIDDLQMKLRSSIAEKDKK